MREILFRGKQIVNGEWVEGYYFCLNDDHHRIYTGYADTDGVEYYPEYVGVIPETVGQFTGLTDKNGKMIFEGDIVRSCVGTYVVKYLTGAWFCSLIECEYLTLLCTISAEEVIGNIHDNPELLKVVNDNG